MATLTIEQLTEILQDKFGGELAGGCQPFSSNRVCARQLRSVALGKRQTADDPDGGESPVDRACQLVNDASQWLSDADRTQHCLPLALLSQDTAPQGWVRNFVERTIHEIVPDIFRRWGWYDTAIYCASARIEDFPQNMAILAAYLDDDDPWQWQWLLRALKDATQELCRNSPDTFIVVGMLCRGVLTQLLTSRQNAIDLCRILIECASPTHPAQPHQQPDP